MLHRTAAGPWVTLLVLSSPACSVWQFSHTATGLGVRKRGNLPPCGLWQSVQSPCAPGCGTFAVAIFFTTSSWQVEQTAATWGWFSLTFPFTAGSWQTSHVLSANGGCK